MKIGLGFTVLEAGSVSDGNDMKPVRNKLKKSTFVLEDFGIFKTDVTCLYKTGMT